MTIFRGFMKLAKNRFVSIVTYIVVFFVIGSVMINNADSGEKVFKASKIDVVVLDEDKSEASKKIKDYILKGQNETTLKHRDTEHINDALRFGVAEFVLFIPKNFEADIKSGKLDTLTYMQAEQSAAGYLMSSKLDMLMNNINIYREAGFDSDDALDHALEAVAQSDAEIEFSKKVKDSSNQTFILYAFNFLSYVMTVSIAVIIGTTLKDLRQKEVIMRMEVSALTFFSRQFQILLGFFTVGFAIFLIFTVPLGFMTRGMEGFHHYPVYMANGFIFLLVCLAFAYLLSEFTTQDSIISMVSNMVGLALAFTSGIFVPQSIISSTVINLSKIGPVYWYAHANKCIQNNSFDGQFYLSLAIEGLYIIALVVTGMIVSKIKRDN